MSNLYIYIYTINYYYYCCYYSYFYYYYYCYTKDFAAVFT